MRSMARGSFLAQCVCSVHFCPGNASPTRAPEAPAQQLRRDLETMKEQMRQMQEKIQQQEEAIEKLSTPAAPPCLPCTLYLRHLPRATENNSSRRSGRRSCATFSRNSRRRKAFPSQFNPAISLAIDTMFAYRQHEGNNFEFRSAELGLSASVDPFVRGYAFFNGTSDDFEVEEAAMSPRTL